MDRKLIIVILLNSLLTGLILVVNWLYLKPLENIFALVNIFAIFIFASPIILIEYNKYRKRKESEELFPVFLRDFVETVKGGLTIPQAFMSLSKNDYKALSYFVKKMSAQLDWGIPVDIVLTKFSKEVKSKIISRIVSSVIESHRFGGNLATTFEALSETSMEVEKLRAERRLYLHSQMITGYIVFFVFLAVIIGLEKFLVPSMTQTSSLGQLSGAISQDVLAREYKSLFRNLIVIQGVFAGLTVGKMSEGSLISGLKHSLFMAIVGIVVFMIAG